MINLKTFIDRVSAAERRGGRDIVLTLEESRGLRDEIAKLLVELHHAAMPSQPEIKVVLKSNNW